jgi:hypothetical protein
MNMEGPKPIIKSNNNNKEGTPPRRGGVPSLFIILGFVPSILLFLLFDFDFISGMARTTFFRPVCTP